MDSIDVCHLCFDQEIMLTQLHELTLRLIFFMVLTFVAL